MKNKIEDMVIVGRGRDLAGEVVITFFYKGQPDLRHITVFDYEEQALDFKLEFIKKYL